MRQRAKDGNKKALGFEKWQLREAGLERSRKRYSSRLWMWSFSVFESLNGYTVFDVAYCFYFCFGVVLSGMETSKVIMWTVFAFVRAVWLMFSRVINPLVTRNRI